MLITITGTESTGKTTLALQLAEHYNTVLVPDISRDYIDVTGPSYTREDVLAIADKIIDSENEAFGLENRLLISDNCLVNIKIWMQYYNWEIPAWLNHALNERKSNLYLLCDIDLDWVKDEQRKNPHDREELYHRFMNEMAGLQLNYHIISGKGKERFNAACRLIDALLQQSR
ncbi:MAG: ATP-binding protein [Chitinophagales bacterium]